MNNPFKRGSKQRVALAYRMMRWCYLLVERIDRGAVPKSTGWAFTFEHNRGAVINNTGNSTSRKGCSLFYINDVDYDRAHEDSLAETTPRLLAEGL